MMAGKRIHVVMDADLVEWVDAAASELGVSRGEFVRRAVERALSEAKGAGSTEQAGPGSRFSSDRGVRPAAPAEQPETGGSMASATRDIGDGPESESSGYEPATSPRPVSTTRVALSRAVAFRRATQR